MGNIYDNETFFAEYGRMSRSAQGLSGAGEWHQLEPLFPPLQNSAVLDLGCGYGWHCKYAADHGASEVLGLDASERMIGEALARNAHPRIRYEVQALDSYAMANGCTAEVIVGTKTYEDLDGAATHEYTGAFMKDGILYKVNMFVPIRCPLNEAQMEAQLHQILDSFE